MIVSERGLALIAEFEGFSPIPYSDPAGHCTVGFGELLHLGPCTPTDMARPPITQAQGYAHLREKVKGYADAVERSTRPLSQNEFDALTSFCYNVGQGGYINSSVRPAVNAHGDVRAALRRYVFAVGMPGVPLPGLVRRREAEADLYYAAEEHMASSEYMALKAAVDALAGVVAGVAKDHNERLAAQSKLLEVLIPPLVEGTHAEATARFIWAAAGKPWPR